MNWPGVTIGILTFNRPKEIRTVYRNLMDCTLYSDGPIEWIISDDSSPGNYLTSLREETLPGTKFISTKKRSGWGVNANSLRAATRTPYLYFTEDDYVATKTVDLMLAVALMEVSPHIGMVRFRGTAGEHMVYHQFEADISKYVPHYQDGVGLPGRVTYLQIDSGSPALYVYSNGPHLVHRRFIDFYGPYPEGLKLGETEEQYAHIVKDGMKSPGAPAIAILPRWIHMSFDHIGQSYQGNSEEDRRFS